MAVLDIAQIGDPVLRQVAEPLTREQLASLAIQQLIDDLIETMHAANGAGLAATQVSRRLRICVIEVRDNPRYPYKPNIPLTVLVNPVIGPIGDDMFDNYEGCLSVPNLRGIVRRHRTVRVIGMDRHGNGIDHVAEGLEAGTFQHEVDHLDGVVFVDRVADTRTLCTWQEFDRHHKAPFVQMLVKLGLTK
jgi:peptide deformylase